ncbi:MAG: DNA polymerase III subunit delta [Clostridiales bacterium]|nr:DNA polymerase III subunit delta [Clostridiales bacterium]
MAKQKTDKKHPHAAPPYSTLVRELREKGPERLYLLWGDERYLLEQFAAELERHCLDSGGDFDRKLLEGPELELAALEEALDSMPFLSQYVFVLLRGVDLNRCREDTAARAAKLLADIPEHTVVVVTLPDGVQPDGRLKLIKAAKGAGRFLDFTVQDETLLVRWIARRFDRLGKRIGAQEARELIFITGGLMDRLASEIEKAAAHAKGEAVTMDDIRAVAHRLPEAGVFELTDRLAVRDFDGAAQTLAELLAMRDVEPIMLMAIIGQQFRRLYAARLAIDDGLGSAYVARVTGISHDFIIRKLMDAARRFSMAQLEATVVLCAEIDYRMKSTPTPPQELLKEFVLRAALEGGRTA